MNEARSVSGAGARPARSRRSRRNASMGFRARAGSRSAGGSTALDRPERPPIRAGAAGGQGLGRIVRRRPRSRTGRGRRPRGRADRSAASRRPRAARSRGSRPGGPARSRLRPSHPRARRSAGRGRARPSWSRPSGRRGTSPRGSRGSPRARPATVRPRGRRGRGARRAGSAARSAGRGPMFRGSIAVSRRLRGGPSPGPGFSALYWNRAARSSPAGARWRPNTPGTPGICK